MRHFYAIVLTVLTTTSLFAQTPWQRVYNTLNTKCQNSSCHSPSATDGSQTLLFSTSESAVYDAIVDQAALNASSVAKHESLIKKGHPYQSFLLRKVAGSSFDTDLALDANEGAHMNDINNQPLTNSEIEMIRQWTMFSAKKTYSGGEGQPDWQAIVDYYNNPTFPFLNKPAKPLPGEGLQFRMGPVFIPPNVGEEEIEMLLQQEVNFPYLPEVYHIEGFMNEQSHHFLLFQFQDSAAAAYRTFGIDVVGGQGLSNGTAFDGNKNLTTGWQDNKDFVLPAGTALFWDQKTYLDMNYHIKNYALNAVLPCDFYFNIYFHPRNPNTVEMKSTLINNPFLFLSTGVQTRYYEDQANGDNEMRYIWNITSHTHKFGTDYDIFVKDASQPNDLGEQIYEGFYNYDYSALDNSYSWEHPAIRTFDSLYAINFDNSGLIARTVWNNTGGSTVTFGFTTADEMQLFYYMYTNEMPEPVSVHEVSNTANVQMRLTPNPARETAAVVYKLEAASNVLCNITDLTGRNVMSYDLGQQHQGEHRIELETKGAILLPGVYLTTLIVNGKAETKRLVIAE